MNNNLTPYAAAKIANAVIEAAGFKRIPPQMVYNYTSARFAQGKAPLIAATQDENGKVWIEESDIRSWVAKYVAKKRAVQLEATSEVEGQLELEV